MGALQDPAFVLNWKASSAEIEVVAGLGEHLAPDAPISARVTYGDSTVTVSQIGDDPLPVFADLRGMAVQAEVKASLCKDQGDECRIVVHTVGGIVGTSKKGTLTLAPAEPHGPVFDVSAYAQDAESRAHVAFAQAEGEGKAVLLDFTAVWCPPCNQLSLEVLHAEEPVAALDAFVVAQIDVDDPSSWAIKDRYAVGGYPTIIAVSADGNELARTVGYSGKDTFVAWLGTASKGGIAGELAAGPASVTPDRAAEIALAVLDTDADPQPWLDRAKASDTVAAHRARFAAAPSVDEALWLEAHWPGHALDWAWSGLEDLEKSPEGRAALRGAFAAAEAEGPAKADALAALADLADDPSEELALRRASVMVLESELSGDFVLDRPWLTELADLRAQAGDLQGALAGLEAATVAFPSDPTFLLTACRLANEADRREQALALAERAYPLAWGDNRLRVAIQKSKALVALGRIDEARAFVAKELADQPVPAEGVDVRTHRYRTQLGETLPK